MKLMGAMLILLGGGGSYLLWKKQIWELTALYRCLLRDLSVLSWNICVRKRMLPDILATCFGDGPAARLFWNPLQGKLAQRRENLAESWRESAAALPDPLPQLMGALGDVVCVGGDVLRGAIEETREELTGLLHEQQQRAAQQGRLVAAICLSGALTLILVLI